MRMCVYIIYIRGFVCERVEKMEETEEFASSVVLIISMYITCLTSPTGHVAQILCHSYLVNSFLVCICM